MNIKLNEQTVRFVVEKIPVIGNLKNSHVIGLNRSGEELINYIEKYNRLPQEIPESLLPLIEMLQTTVTYIVWGVILMWIVGI